MNFGQPSVFTKRSKEVSLGLFTVMFVTQTSKQPSEVGYSQYLLFAKKETGLVGLSNVTEPFS